MEYVIALVVVVGVIAYVARRRKKEPTPPSGRPPERLGRPPVPRPPAPAAPDRESWFAPANANVSARWIEGTEWHSWEPPCNAIRGEARTENQRTIRAVAGMRRPRHQGFLKPVAVELVREPTNEYDRNALAALVDGMDVGYLGREFAAEIAPHMDSHGMERLVVCGVIRGGSPDADFLGVHLWFDRRLADGLSLPHLSAAHMVAWPPFDGEGV